MPLGLSFWGPRWSEARLLGFGFAYQQKGGRFTPPTYRHSVEGGIAAEAAFSPSR
jgi:amidase